MRRASTVIDASANATTMTKGETSSDGRNAAESGDAVSKPDARVLLDFLFSLGQAYLAGGEQTAQVELTLRRVASAYGMRRTSVVAFPTAILIRMSDGATQHVDLAPGPGRGLRLDQIAHVYTLGAAAQRGEVVPELGLQRLNAIMREPARFGFVGSILGHTILTVGVAMILVPAFESLLYAALLGALIGAVKLVKGGQPVFAVPLPVIAAAIVSGVVFSAVRYGYGVEPLHVLVPPLVTFLPGVMLTMGMVELAYGDMVSGSSRLITGFVQLVLLAFGLAAGAMVVGMRSDFGSDVVPLVDPIPWVPWLGVVVFGLGVSIHFSAPRRSLPWMLLVMLAAFAAQQMATRTFGSETSGFWGALVATPLAYLVQMRFGGPPAMVTFLPSFWVLVPGALGLLSVKRMLTDRAAGIDGLVTVVFVIASIALGTLMGAALYKWVTETFGAWQFRLGRADRPRRGESKQ
ncbi:MAG: threonine/serine exporter family protein [Phycisphaerales bacterium]